MAHHLYLLDGMALAYRAYFALIRNPISTSTGRNTSAIYGFVNTLLELKQQAAPTHMAIAMDTDAPTARHERFPAYKAQRDEMPEDLSDSLQAIDQFAAAFRIPMLRLDGYEADDIIGTLARQAAAKGWKVTMVTPDKDFGQLVTDDIVMYRPGRMGNPPEVWGVEEVCSRWGIERVDQVRDMLGLMGDSSDNIPGIPGIGEKTAAKLIAQFGSVETLLEGTAQLKGKQKERVETHRDQALLSKELATIDIEVPIEVNWEELELSDPDEEALRSLCVEFEFNSIGRRLLGDDFKAGRGFSSGSAPPGELFAPEEIEGAAPVQEADLNYLADVEHEYQVIRERKDYDSLLGAMAMREAFCFDLETDALDAKQAAIVGIAVCWEAGRAHYVVWPEKAAEAEAWLAALAPLLQSDRHVKVGHNLKFDLGVLRWHGVRSEGPFFDTMLAHALIAPDKRHGMDELSEQYLGYSPVSIESLIGAKGKEQKSVREVPEEELAEYAAEDADVTWQLMEVLKPILAKHRLEKVFNEVECPLLPVLVEMEYHGVRIDSKALAEYSKELETDIDRLRREVFQLAGEEFNLNSPKQLGEVFFDRLHLAAKPKKTRTGQYVTNEQVLETLAVHHPIARKVLEYREANKLQTTYVEALPAVIFPKTGRLHTNYSQVVAATGRLASNNPNLQNIPIRTDRGREIRRAFVADKGYQIFAADYSQIELRIMASLSGDQAMQEAFVSELDIHTATAAGIHGVDPDDVTEAMRRSAKMVNFGIIYGISAFGLAQRLAIPRAEANRIIESYFAKYPGIRRYMGEVVEDARQKGYVETMSGRRRYVPDLRSSNGAVRQGAERMTINTPIQGTAADMIKIAMARIHAWLMEQGTETKLLLQVHDELVFELCPEERDLVIPKITELMQNALPMDVPILVETGVAENWLDAH